MRDSANLLPQYRLLHAEAAGYFPGRSLMPWCAEIKLLVMEYGTKSILDYGCGKAWCYERIKVQDWWGVMPTLYDPGLSRYATKPAGTFGGVICSDVMEHLAEDDVGHYLREIWDYTAFGGWCVMSICCRPANSILPDGRNAHQTVKPEAWWRERIGAVFVTGKQLQLHFTA